MSDDVSASVITPDDPRYAEMAAAAAERDKRAADATPRNRHEQDSRRVEA